MNEPDEAKPKPDPERTYYLDADAEPIDFAALAKLSVEELQKLRDEGKLKQKRPE